jgi:hypothetical protein
MHCPMSGCWDRVGASGARDHRVVTNADTTAPSTATAEREIADEEFAASVTRPRLRYGRRHRRSHEFLTSR